MYTFAEISPPKPTVIGPDGKVVTDVVTTASGKAPAAAPTATANAPKYTHVDRPVVDPAVKQAENAWMQKAQAHVQVLARQFGPSLQQLSTAVQGGVDIATAVTAEIERRKGEEQAVIDAGNARVQQYLQTTCGVVTAVNAAAGVACNICVNILSSLIAFIPKEAYARGIDVDNIAYNKAAVALGYLAKMPSTPDDLQQKAVLAMFADGYFVYVPKYYSPRSTTDQTMVQTNFPSSDKPLAKYAAASAFGVYTGADVQSPQKRNAAIFQQKLDTILKALPEGCRTIPPTASKCTDLPIPFKGAPAGSVGARLYELDVEADKQWLFGRERATALARHPKNKAGRVVYTGSYRIGSFNADITWFAIHWDSLPLIVQQLVYYNLLNPDIAASVGTSTPFAATQNDLLARVIAGTLANSLQSTSAESALATYILSRPPPAAALQFTLVRPQLTRSPTAMAALVKHAVPNIPTPQTSSPQTSQSFTPGSAPVETKSDSAMSPTIKLVLAAGGVLVASGLGYVGYRIWKKRQKASPTSDVSYQHFAPKKPVPRRA